MSITMLRSAAMGSFCAHCWRTPSMKRLKRCRRSVKRLSRCSARPISSLAAYIEIPRSVA
ncbi:hypothetical protein D3C81_2045920 [compost metagenome]